MKKVARQDGFVLLITLFLLSCTMLWGSLLLLALSDQYDASNDVLKQEQSRLLAYSGWNLALQQLETNGELLSVMQEQSTGTIEVSLQEYRPGIVSVEAKGTAGGYKQIVDGEVQLQASVWSQVLDWPVMQNEQEMQAPGRILSAQRQYQLAENCMQPIAIGALNREPVEVEITKPISVMDLYVDGDLVVHAPFKATTLYISGQITGLEYIDCQEIISAETSPLYYHIDVLERNL